MPRSSADILALARTELIRGRPRAALKELEAARAELVAAADATGLAEALELALGVKTLAPADTKSRERLLTALEQGIAALSPAAAVEPVSALSVGGRYLSHAAVSSAPFLATARAEMERGDMRRALRSLEKARQKLLDRGDVDALTELLDMARRLPTAKARHEKARGELIDATRQNVRYLSRRKALKAGEEWSDPFAAAGTKTSSRLPSLPPMTRREIAIAAVIVVAIIGGITAWALASRAPQRVAHAINCPTGDEGSPTWSPDGKEIAFAKNGSCGTQITIISAEGGPTREVTEKYGVLPDWSPDGQTILYRSKDGFSTISVGGGDPHLIRKDDGDMGARWSPNGKRIAFVHGLAPDLEYEEDFLSTLYTMKSDGSGVRRLLGHVCNPRTPAWSADGDWLLFACDSGVYGLLANGGDREQLVKADFSYRPVSISVTPDFKLLAFGWIGVETKRIFEPGDPKTFVAVDDSQDAIIDVDWSPDGRTLAFSISGSRSDDGLYVIDREGKHRRLLVEF